jgi:hypothetical protein
MSRPEPIRFLELDTHAFVRGAGTFFARPAAWVTRSLKSRNVTAPPVGGRIDHRFARSNRLARLGCMRCGAIDPAGAL